MMFEPWLEEFVAEWREHQREARDLFADDARARLIGNIVDALELKARDADESLLSGIRAGGYSGYSSDHLRRLVKRGVLRDYGRKGAPRYRRSELPIKVGAQNIRLHIGANEPTVCDTRPQIARAVIHRHVGGDK